MSCPAWYLARFGRGGEGRGHSYPSRLYVIANKLFRVSSPWACDVWSAVAPLPGGHDGDTQMVKSNSCHFTKVLMALHGGNPAGGSLCA